MPRGAIGVEVHRVGGRRPTEDVVPADDRRVRACRVRGPEAARTARRCRTPWSRSSASSCQSAICSSAGRDGCQLAPRPDGRPASSGRSRRRVQWRGCAESPRPGLSVPGSQNSSTEIAVREVAQFVVGLAGTPARSSRAAAGRRSYSTTPGAPGGQSSAGSPSRGAHGSSSRSPPPRSMSPTRRSGERPIRSIRRSSSVSLSAASSSGTATSRSPTIRLSAGTPSPSRRRRRRPRQRHRSRAAGQQDRRRHSRHRRRRRRRRELGRAPARSRSRGARRPTRVRRERIASRSDTAATPTASAATTATTGRSQRGMFMGAYPKYCLLTMTCAGELRLPAASEARAVKIQSPKPLERFA